MKDDDYQAFQTFSCKCPNCGEIFDKSVNIFHSDGYFEIEGVDDEEIPPDSLDLY